jgi:hypothetical protein
VDIAPKDKLFKIKKLMKQPSIRKKWEDFKNIYPLLILSNDEIWMNNLADVKEYVVKTGELPSQKAKDTKIKQMGQWISTQKINYAKSKTIMKEPSIRKEWEDFKHKISTVISFK